MLLPPPLIAPPPQPVGWLAALVPTWLGTKSRVTFIHVKDTPWTLDVPTSRLLTSSTSLASPSSRQMTDDKNDPQTGNQYTNDQNRHSRRNHIRYQVPWKETFWFSSHTSPILALVAPDNYYPGRVTLFFGPHSLDLMGIWLSCASEPFPRS